jgi:hypothetical protein
MVCEQYLNKILGLSLVLEIFDDITLEREFHCIICGHFFNANTILNHLLSDTHSKVALVSEIIDCK